MKYKVGDKVKIREDLKVKLPMRYGFPFRAFYGVSLLKFKRRMMERFKIDDKEFNKQLKELEREEND